jgi:hypothetical protein
MALNQFMTKVQEPHMDEGFAEIKRINFVPHFENEDDKEAWHRWYK